MSDAIEKAVTDCIHDNILADILRSHKAEVTNMILDEYDEKFHIASEKNSALHRALKRDVLLELKKGVLWKNTSPMQRKNVLIMLPYQKIFFYFT